MKVRIEFTVVGYTELDDLDGPGTSTTSDTERYIEWYEGLRHEVENGEMDYDRVERTLESVKLVVDS